MTVLALTLSAGARSLGHQQPLYPRDFSLCIFPWQLGEGVVVGPTLGFRVACVESTRATETPR